MNTLFIVSIIAGAAYWPTFGVRENSVARAAAKTFPVASLAAAALLGNEAYLLIGALALSALGDWILAFKGERFFIAGLVSFLTAHLAYCALFFAGEDSLWSGGTIFFVGLVAIFALTLGVYRRLLPHLGAMRWPVAVYCGVIAAMAVAAWSRGPDPLLLSGVALFLLSDIVLAFETFVLDENSASRRWTGLVIWVTYFSGQALIASTFLFNPAI